MATKTENKKSKCGSMRKKGRKYEFAYQYKGVRYTDSIYCDEVKNEKEAEEKLADFCSLVRKGEFYNTSYTFREFTLIWWKNVAVPNHEKSTRKAYKSFLRKRIFPALGHYNLNEINPFILNRFFNELKESDTIFENRENKPIKKATIEKIRNIINTILQTAFEYELIGENPCRRVKLKLDNIKSEIQKELDSDVDSDDGDIHYYDRATYNKVLCLLQSEDINKRTIIELALKTGLRRSEIAGLRWRDIDFEKCEMAVRISRQYIEGEIIIKKLKNKRSRRISISENLVKLLKEYYKENKNNEYIFEKINMDSFCSWFRDWQVEKGIERITFHDLRHTHATLLLLAGVDIKTISERLGHSSIKITMDKYAHFLKELDRKACEALETL